MLVAQSSSYQFAAKRLTITLLFLGIVVYAGIPYSNIPFEQHWPVKARQTSILFDLLFALSNYFRMPLLILLAGFAFGLIHKQQSKLNQFYYQYVKALLLSLFVIIPIALLGFNYYESGMDYLPDLSKTDWLFILSRYPLTLHVWYIYYVILFSSSVCLFRSLFQSWQNFFCKNSNKLIARNLLFLSALLAKSNGQIILLLLPTIGIILLFESNVLEAGISLIPDPRVFIGHLLFFLFGYYLADCKAAWHNLASQWQKWLLLFVIIFPINLWVSFLRLSRPHQSVSFNIHLVTAVSYALCAWFACFALLGLFARFFNHPERHTFLSEASARICYILHPPLVIWLPIMMDTMTRSLWIKLTITLLLLLVYSYSVCCWRQLLLAKSSIERSLRIK